ncbi:MAG: hypothetical protein FWE59_00695 [Oscillospiraceae bacterium]|nr:hypothetical protein [Oscillospiraceae bacterium]
MKKIPADTAKVIPPTRKKARIPPLVLANNAIPPTNRQERYKTVSE